jgi:hypothetical protein
MHRKDPDLVPSRATRVGWPLLVCAVTVAYALVPYLLEPTFYQRGDTAVQFAPTWYHLGELVRGGTWPPVVDVDAWQGGNYASEALFGVYNPLNALIWLFVSGMPDLVIATLAVKVTVLMLLALGTYVLLRSYACAPWAAAVVATALPFSGFTLYWDAGSWPSGLIAFAYTPWVWWAFRRCLEGTGGPFWAFVIGVLAVTQGNPYGTLAVVVVGAGLLLEGVVRRRWSGVLLLALAGLCVAAFLPLVYFPLMETSSLAVRSTGDLVENSGKLRPELGDLFGLSSPTLVPTVQAITGPMQVPVTYLSWLVVPLLPWFRWRVLGERWQGLIAVGVVTVGYLALTIGPSKLWLFRWPVRLVEYGWLGLAVVLGILLTAGLHRTRLRARATATAVLVLAIAWQTWSEHPEQLRRAALGVAVVALGAALFLGWHLLRPRATALLALLAVGTTGVTLALQVAVFGENEGSRLWRVPSDVAELQRDFGDLEGTTMQFADFRPQQRQRDVDRLERAWRSYLPGSLYEVAGVDAVNAYTGLGYRDFGRTFCMEYDGFTRQCGYRALWRPTQIEDRSLADLMKVETVVVQPSLARGVDPEPGWTVDDQDVRFVLTRNEPLAWPDSRLSHADEGLEVVSARTLGDADERVELTASDGGRLVFAAIAWPGWSATLDGRPLEVDATSAGLLVVRVPADASGSVDVRFEVPRQRLGLAAAGLGAGAALVLTLGAWLVHRRRGEDPDPVEDGVGDHEHAHGDELRQQQ